MKASKKLLKEYEDLYNNGFESEELADLMEDILNVLESEEEHDRKEAESEAEAEEVEVC